MKELVNTEDLQGSFKDVVLKSCEKLCGKKKEGPSEEGSTWWNEKVHEAIKRKKNAFREICKIRSEENKDNYKRERNQTRKIVSRAMRKEAEQEMNIIIYVTNQTMCLSL